ncbi:MAG: rod shape-determining protein MreD [Candidatus Nanopelagicaceae bacterium]
MSWQRAGFSSLFLLFFFVIQESAISKINFPISGFSLYLCVLLGLMALEDRFGAIALGFIGGIILDLSPSSDSPFGKWALILTLVGYLFSRNRESIGDFTQRPVAFILFVSAGVTATLAIFLILGIVFGENNGALLNNLQTIFGNGIWTLLFSSVLLPGLVKLREFSLTSRERI